MSGEGSFRSRVRHAAEDTALPSVFPLATFLSAATFSATSAGVKTRADGSPGIAYALHRIRRIVRPPVTITPPPKGVRLDRDVEVKTNDGTILRVNVFRPPGDGPFPVILCAHPYGKDNMPKRGLFGGYRPALQYRVLRQPAPVRFSAWTGWEAPDPAYWAARGYAVVNADLRGFFRSEGVGDLISDQEAEDYRDLIEWAATQPWSNGKVGLNGVSYLALSQWKVAALRPPHLAAICPWEGFTDLYRDFARPGGILEAGFSILWSAGVRRGGRTRWALRDEMLARPAWDDFWAARVADLERIEVPALICGSFSDHSLHSRGSFEGFRRISSKHRWLYTHRAGKWATYYSDEALAFQTRFFDCFLKGEENGMREVPPVRLEVRERGDAAAAVRGENEWPLARTRWTKLHLHADGSLRAETASVGRVELETQNGAAMFAWTLAEDAEISGPMKLRLHVEIAGGGDACLFVGIRKLSRGQHVVFEGSYGFGCDLVTRGWLRVSHRQLDAQRSTEWQPVQTHVDPKPLAAGEIAALDIAVLPSATIFRAGDVLRLDVQGHWFFRKNPLFGSLPAAYERSQPARVILHLGDAYLLVPIVPE